MTETDTSKQLLSYAFYLLARQDYSEFKLRQKLKLKSDDLDLIQSTIETIKSKGYLQEDRYRISKIKMRLKQGKGKRIIKDELSHELLQVEESHMQEALVELGVNQDDLLKGLIEKKLRRVNKEELSSEEKYKLKNKILSFLARNGHSFEDSLRLLKNYL
jgi:regulatory protein